MSPNNLSATLEILTRFVNDRRYMGLKNLVDKHNRSYFGLEFSYETIPNELVPFDYDTFAAFPGHRRGGGDQSGHRQGGVYGGAPAG